MLAWSEWELITDVRKPEIMVMTLIAGGELFTDYSDHPQTCHAKPKTQINSAPDATSFFLLVGCHRAVCPNTSLRKSGRCGIAAD